MSGNTYKKIGDYESLPNLLFEKVILGVSFFGLSSKILNVSLAIINGCLHSRKNEWILGCVQHLHPSKLALIAEGRLLRSSHHVRRVIEAHSPPSISPQLKICFACRWVKTVAAGAHTRRMSICTGVPQINSAQIEGGSVVTSSLYGISDNTY